MKRLLLIGLLCFAPFTLDGCAKAPPSLSQEGIHDFHKTRVVQGLDLLRDFAISAEAQSPKVLQTDTTRKVVLYHQSALRIIQSTDTGWQSALTTALDEVLANVPPTERTRLAPYVALIKTVLAEVIR